MTNSSDTRLGNIFITGGAGFIGSRLSKALAAHGAQVTIFDNLHPQVHGASPVLELDGELVVGDVRDRAALDDAVRICQPRIVIHLAAETGTGQSADEPARYCEVNVTGTANLIESLKGLASPPSRFLLAATRAVYGEGAYRESRGTLVVPPPRRTDRMRHGEFDVEDEAGQKLKPALTPETMPPTPGSVYGSTKLMQEYLVSQVPSSWDHVILRLQNVYGPGQSLQNPYTGVLSIFCQQALSGQVLEIYEDGEIYRDFIFVDDVVSAFVAACSSQTAVNRTMNIGTGKPTSIRLAAETILTELGCGPDRLRISGAFRAGDVRYAVADITETTKHLGWMPNIEFENGIKALALWAREKTLSPA